MIRSFRHKGLKRLFEEDDKRGVPREHLEKIRDILVRLDNAESLADLALPGLKLHELKGDSKGIWAVTVRANWRITFSFIDPDAFNVDYVDYH